MNKIKILNPRYKDDTVLVADYQIKEGKNGIYFSQAKHLPGTYLMDSSKIRSYPVQTIKSKRGFNIKMFVVPLADFQVIPN